MKSKIATVGIHTFAICSLAMALSIGQVRAITFTNDTLISLNNITYDGADIVITNCTVTIDGGHAFNNLTIRQGGVVTHSGATNGFLNGGFTVTNEQHVLTGSNIALLNYTSSVVSTVVVMDATNSVVYSNTVDYVLLYSTSTGVMGIQRTTLSAISDGARVNVTYTVIQNPPTGLNLNITATVLVEQGGAINVNGKGYGSGFGPGTGTSYYLGGGGGGYG